MNAQPTIPGFMVLNVANVYVAELDVDLTPEFPLPPITIIDPNTPFEVWAEVELSGRLISLLGNSPWTIEYYAERMGTGPDLVFGPVAGTWPAIAHNSTAATLTKAETRLRVEAPREAAPGLYKLTCVFKSGASDYILGFAEGGMFQVAENC